MTSSFHSLPYPSLEEGNVSYPNGVYEGVAQSLGDADGVRITHNLESAGFIEKQIARGTAEFACLLSVPNTGHRELCRSRTKDQDVNWDMGVVGEPPIVRPVIVAVKEFEHTFTDSDDVAEIWVGKKVRIPKGARLARDTFLRSQAPSMRSLLRVVKDENLPAGTFETRATHENGFMFVVRVAPDLQAFLANPGLNDLLRASIGAHMVTSCLALLRQTFGTSGEGANYMEYSNLKMLAGMLENLNMPIWTDDDFKPDLAATALHPIVLPTSHSEGGE